jgi:hypothetical protein
MLRLYFPSPMLSAPTQTAIELPNPLARPKAPSLLQELRQYAAEPLASEQAAILSSGKGRLWWAGVGASLALTVSAVQANPKLWPVISYVGASVAIALATGASLEEAKGKAHHRMATTIRTARPDSAIASAWLNTEARQLRGFDKLVSQHLFEDWLNSGQAPALTIAAQPIADAPSLPVAEDLGRNPQSALIGGVSGAGKGVFYLQALAHLKAAHPETQVMLINPKQSGGELGTGKAPALVLSRDISSGSSPDESALWLWDCVEQFKRWTGPKLLIIDEMASVMATLKLAARSLQILPKFREFLSHITSMGDSERHWLWLVSQDCSTEGLGMSSSLRANLRAIGLIAPHNRQALKAFLAGGWLPMPDGGRAELDALMQASEVGRAVFDGKQALWLPMARLENLTGWDRDSGSPVASSPTKTAAAPFWDDAPELDYFDVWAEWLHNRPSKQVTVRQACQGAPRLVRTTAEGTREAFRQLARMNLGTFDEATDTFTVASP